jgi:hypothetical protein
MVLADTAWKRAVTAAAPLRRRRADTRRRARAS